MFDTRMIVEVRSEGSLTLDDERKLIRRLGVSDPKIQMVRKIGREDVKSFRIDNPVKDNS